ncbi:MAG: hypothetical protein V2I63_11495 [Pseudomonadales bacterium]|jgi:hypothetical protein|nr:hypothetical protein [Pseudomonadales bacterium]
MNPNHLLRRLHQPRSNMASMILITATVLVFALVAQTAIDQQRTLTERPDEHRAAPHSLSPLELHTELRALLNPLQF